MQRKYGSCIVSHKRWSYCAAALLYTGVIVRRAIANCEAGFRRLRQRRRASVGPLLDRNPVPFLSGDALSHAAVAEHLCSRSLHVVFLWHVAVSLFFRSSLNVDMKRAECFPRQTFSGSFLSAFAKIFTTRAERGLVEGP